MSNASSAVARGARWRILINTGIVMLGALLSRVLGLFRDAIIFNQFGTTPEIGVFRATFTILDILYLVIIGGALGSALIPVFSRLLEAQAEERAWEVANTVLTTAFLGFVLLAVVVGIFARPVLAVSVARGYADQPELLDLAVHLLRLMLLQPLLLGLGGLMMALLQSFERFTLPAVAFNVYNLTIIAAAWLFAPTYRIDALAWGVVGGALLYFLVQLPGVVQAGLRFRPSLHWRMPEVVRVGQLLAPRLLGQSALQLNIIVMYSLISYLGSSAQAANSAAYQLLMLPHGILAVSLGTVIFPRLSRFFAANRLDDVRELAFQMLRLVVWLTVPVAIVLAVLNVPLIRLLFQRGLFDNESLQLTSRALLFYAPGVIGLAGAEIVIRTFYAMEDTRTPVVVGVLAIILNALLAYTVIIFHPDIGLVVLAYSFTNLLEFGMLFVVLARRLGGIRNAAAARSVIALGVGSLALLLTLISSVWLAQGIVPGVTLNSAYGQGYDFFVLAAWFGVVGLLGIGIYLAMGIMLRAPEVRELRALLRRKA